MSNFSNEPEGVGRMLSRGAGTQQTMNKICEEEILSRVKLGCAGGRAHLGFSVSIQRSGTKASLARSACTQSQVCLCGSTVWRENTERVDCPMRKLYTRISTNLYMRLMSAIKVHGANILITINNKSDVRYMEIFRILYRGVGCETIELRFMLQYASCMWRRGNCILVFPKPYKQNVDRIWNLIFKWIYFAFKITFVSFVHKNISDRS